jgi:dTMP kinase
VSAAGILVVLEGIDGAGTTTQARRLGERLAALEVPAHLTREPSDGPIGLLLREMLTGKHAPVDTTTLGLLFAADRADHIQREVAPALARGAIVVSDRWYHSSLAYQGSDEDRAWIAELNRRARRPELTLFLDVPVEVAAARRAAAGRDDELFDALEVQRRVAASYRKVMNELADRETISVLDGELSQDALHEDIVARVADAARTAGLAWPA